jgi:RNase adaptor protein for sRNA GlmZ degradation
MAILVDINGTIASEGKPIQKSIDYLKTLSTDIYFISGSHESLRKRYESLLERFGLSYVEIILNPIDDNKDYQFKLAMAQTIPNLEFAIDNNIRVLELYQSVGIKTVHPDEL